LFVSSLLNAEYNRTEENWVASNNRNNHVDRNNEVTENWQGEDQDIDEQDVEEDTYNFETT
jgi:hypothetical protein